MEICTGLVVKSKAGRDKDSLLVVTAFENGCVFLCDGKYRPLTHCKKKKLKHIALTNKCLSQDSMQTNRQIRKSLAALQAELL